MRNLFVASATLAAAIGMLTEVPVGGQAQTGGAKTWTQPRTAWGDPDIQGVWDQATGTPLERPAEYAGREFLTDEEAIVREQTRLGQGPGGTGRAASGAAAEGGLPTRGYPTHWLEGSKNAFNRTSLLVDPPDGKLPYTPEGAARAKARSAQFSAPPDSWEDFNHWDRCLTRGVPRIPNNYLSYMMFVQNPGSVVILNEMIHETRIIPLDGSPHLGPDIRLWMGDSRGHWDGNTLVIETTNFQPQEDMLRPGFRQEHMRLVERFTQTDAETLDYSFTVEDPTKLTFTRPWTANIPLTKKDTSDRILEYACHEGNRNVAMALGGARLAEKEKAAKAQSAASPKN